MYARFAFIFHILVQQQLRLFNSCITEGGLRSFLADDNSQVVLDYTRPQLYKNIRIYDLGEWRGLRVTIFMQPCIREPGTHILLSKTVTFFFWDTIRTKPLMNFRKNKKNIMLKNELIIYFPNSGRPGTQRYNTNKIVLKTDLIVFFSRSGKQNHHIHIFSGVCLQEHMQRAICLPVIRSYSHRFSLFAA